MIHAGTAIYKISTTIGYLMGSKIDVSGSVKLQRNGRYEEVEMAEGKEDDTKN